MLKRRPFRYPKKEVPFPHAFSSQIGNTRNPPPLGLGGGAVVLTASSQPLEPEGRFPLINTPYCYDESIFYQKTGD
jgi:hypothetical protein